MYDNEAGYWSIRYNPFFKGWLIFDERGHIAAWSASRYIAEDIVKSVNESRGLGTSEMYVS